MRWVWVQIFGVKQEVGRASREVTGGGERQKSFFWVCFGCVWEHRATQLPEKLEGFAGVGAVKSRGSTRDSS